MASQGKKVRIDFPDNMRDFVYTRAEIGWLTLEALRGFIVFMGVLVVGLLVYTGLQLVDYPVAVLMRAENLGSIAGSVALGAGSLFAMTALFFFLTWRRALRQRIVTLPLSFGFTDQALYGSCLLVDSRTSWDFFQFFRETKRGLVFYDGMRTYYIPKRIWSGVELDRLRALCKDHIPHRRPLFNSR